MNIKLKFDFYTKIIYIPDGYIDNLHKLQLEFLDWVSRQSECLTDSCGLSYDAEDFLKYVNDVVLENSREKAYFLQNGHSKKTMSTIKF